MRINLLAAGALVVALAVPAGASAQQAQGPATRGQNQATPSTARIQHRWSKRLGDLNLSGDQQQHIQSLINQYSQAHPEGSPRDPGASRELRKQIMGVLNSDQQSQYHAEMRARRAQMQQRRAQTGQPGMGGPQDGQGQYQGQPGQYQGQPGGPSYGAGPQGQPNPQYGDPRAPQPPQGQIPSYADPRYDQGPGGQPQEQGPPNQGPPDQGPPDQGPPDQAPPIR
jgi:hypothetical protein